MTCECGCEIKKMKFTIPTYEVKDCRTFITRRRVCKNCWEKHYSKSE